MLLVVVISFGTDSPLDLDIKSRLMEEVCSAVCICAQSCGLLDPESYFKMCGLLVFRCLRRCP